MLTAVCAFAWVLPVLLAPFSFEMVHMDNLCTAIQAMSVCIPFNSSPWQYAATLRVAHESHLHSKKYAPGNDAERRLMTRVKRSAQIIDDLYLRQPMTFEEKIEAFTIPPLPQRIPSTIPSPPACKQDDAAWTQVVTFKV